MLLKHTADFIKYFDSCLADLLDRVKNVSRNLIVVNQNSPFIFEVVRRTLQSGGTPFAELDATDLHKQYSSTGGYLRYILNSGEEQLPVAIIDYSKIVTSLPLASLAEEININRDLFTKIFTSTIVIVPPSLIDILRVQAYDFWSCVELYIDGTLWLQNPRDLPIWYTKYYLSGENINYIRSLGDTVYTQFIVLYGKMMEISLFSEEGFQKCLQSINDIRVISNYLYTELYLLFVDRLINSRVKSSNRKAKMHMIEQLDIDTGSGYLDAHIFRMLGGYFYNCGNYLAALRYFQKVISCLEYISGESGDSLRATATINIRVCKFLLQEYSEKELILSLNEFIDDPCFANKRFDVYRRLLSLLLNENSYAAREEDIDVIAESLSKAPELFSAINWCEDLIFWENLLLGHGSTVYYQSRISKDNSDVLRLAYKCVYAFCEGDCDAMEKYYKRFKKATRQYEYRIIWTTMVCIYENMKHILSLCGDAKTESTQ